MKSSFNWSQFWTLRRLFSRRSVTFERSPLLLADGDRDGGGSMAPTAEAPPNWLFSTIRRHFKRT